MVEHPHYRSILMDRTKHSNTRYLDNKIKVTKIINSQTFKTSEKLDGLYEVEMYKNSIAMDNPIQIAKLRMLEFYYDCIKKYFIDNSFELTKTDKNRIYMAINAPTIDECIRNECNYRFKQEIFESCSDSESPVWFPRRCCQRHLALDGRHLGTFKCEWGE